MESQCSSYRTHQMHTYANKHGLLFPIGFTWIDLAKRKRIQTHVAIKKYPYGKKSDVNSQSHAQRGHTNAAP